MKEKKIKNLSSSAIIADYETGEVKVETKNFKPDAEPRYFKMYIDDIGKILDLTDCERKAILQLSCSMGYNGIIPLLGPMKQIIMKQLGINNVSLFDRRIKALKDEGLLLPVINPHTKKIARGVYQINPLYVAKGSWSDIKKLRLIVEYTGAGRYVATELETNQNELIKADPVQIDSFEDDTTAIHTK